LSKYNTDLVVILGPTASGKTTLATQLAVKTDGQIISADSRQVYKKMNIGTGKDLSEYTVNNKIVDYHLIDICEAGDKYNIARFQNDFTEVFVKLQSKRVLPILCGGSGLYIQSVLEDMWHTQIPINEQLRQQLFNKTQAELEVVLFSYKSKNTYDTSSIKRLMRAIEISDFLNQNIEFQKKEFKDFKYKIFGLNPELETRRNKISSRLKERLEKQGMIDEVKGLMDSGLTADSLIYYGLEYKYITEFLLGKMNYEQMFIKLETEIHRFAKRQMTFFRSLEKKGFSIEWIENALSLDQKSDFVLSKIM
jgi:tRNA dimethylallyltransferase